MSAEVAMRIGYTVYSIQGERGTDLPRPRYSWAALENLLLTCYNGS